MTSWEHASRLEHILKQGILDQSLAASTRLQLLETYDDLLLGDLFTAIEKNVLERLWTLVYYKPIEALRSQLRSQHQQSTPPLTNSQNIKRELSQELQSASATFNSIIIELQARGNLDLVQLAADNFYGQGYPLQPPAERPAIASPTFQSMAFGCIHHCLIYLGDLARYGDAASADLAQLYYRKCLALSPAQGKPYSQLAIVALHKSFYLDAAYWFSLAMSTSQPFTVARENLASLIAKAQVAPSSPPSSTSPLHILKFFKFALSPHDQDMSIPVGYHSEVCTGIDASAKALDCTRLHQVLVLMMAAMQELERKFATDLPSARTRIRSVQVLVLTIIVNIIVSCLSVLADHVGGNSDHLERLFVFLLKEDQDPIMSLLSPVALAAAYLAHNIDLFAIALKYANPVEAVNNVQRLMYAIQNILNASQSVLSEDTLDTQQLASTYMDVSVLPEDADLLGLLSMAGFYRKVERVTLIQYLRNLETNQQGGRSISKVTIERLERIHYLAKRMANDEACLFRFELFKYDSKKGFLVMDDSTKLQIQRERSEALGKEYQKQQVQEAKKSARAIVVVDAGVLLEYLWLVKKWVSRGQCIVVIAQEVLEQLDRLKKGTSEQSISARAATRFLEAHTRIESSRQYLRLQSPVETVAPGNKISLPIPKHTRNLVSCALHFATVLPYDDTDMFMVVCTDDKTRAACKECDLPTTTALEWNSRVG
ncbi:hypothetical protein SmJEL517_g04258 [Synchytrium microbalum]|uniref:PIN domain-containing protein n=1 Tax=Synchytrium microbalum TaxID=1806994 RepID=A0A507C461_9FUNG|nr:uncharacterized protein SmJEL517_g04258 [Synchytrium microbalum]TPX32756.1 hypothetical protein SmJEL517_g04258 [Synchytrium microbalum]